MSSEKERNPYDWYPTPRWCVSRLLEKVYLPTGIWMEPCVGEGNIVKYANEWKRENGKILSPWYTNDIREDHLQVDQEKELIQLDETGDAVEFIKKHGSKIDVLFTNPPYSHPLCLDIVEAAVKHVPTSAFLLRLNWLGSKRRHEFLKEHWPAIYVLPQRPCFRSDGNSSDMTEYAWLIWSNRTMKGGVLDLTPLDERRSDEEEMHEDDQD